MKISNSKLWLSSDANLPNLFLGRHEETTDVKLSFSWRQNRRKRRLSLCSLGSPKGYKSQTFARKEGALHTEIAPPL
jgi:hypothetical protein